MAEYVTGSQIKSILADARSLMPGRRVDDDCNALLRFANDASGVLISSQVASGERNALSFQVYGEKGALHWVLEQADQLRMVHEDGVTEILLPTSPGLLARGTLPPTLGQGILTSFAYLYRDFAAALDGDVTRIGTVLPGIEDGLRGVRFFEAVSRAPTTGWISLA
jgi:predicted dehydrogenase